MSQSIGSRRSSAASARAVWLEASYSRRRPTPARIKSARCADRPTPFVHARCAVGSATMCWSRADGTHSGAPVSGSNVASRRRRTLASERGSPSSLESASVTTASAFGRDAFDRAQARVLARPRVGAEGLLAAGPGGKLDPVAGTNAPAQAVDAVLDGVVAEIELAADLVIGQPRRHEPQQAEVMNGQLVGGALVGEQFLQRRGRSRRQLQMERALAAGDAAQHPQRLRRRELEIDEALDPGGEQPA